ncbi:MAG TPA: hypothetical protein ENN68_04315 [Methanomicrobia archaeon]|nr:hypothetical protein [Methanomicrobia archaeon]
MDYPPIYYKRKCNPEGHFIDDAREISEQDLIRYLELFGTVRVNEYHYSRFLMRWDCTFIPPETRRTNGRRLREAIVSALLAQGFVIDLGNGIILTTIEEWRVYQSALAAVTRDA